MSFSASPWPIMSPMSVHQSDMPHSGMVETTGDKNGSIHRQFSSVSTPQGGSSPLAQLMLTIFQAPSIPRNPSGTHVNK